MSAVCIALQHLSQSTFQENSPVKPQLKPLSLNRPPGLDDDELPPGEDSAQAEPAVAYTEFQDPGLPGGTPAEASAEGQPEAQPEAAPPPPPVAPKKEPTVIHVPLKVPEGARKKQVLDLCLLLSKSCLFSLSKSDVFVLGRS